MFKSKRKDKSNMGDSVILDSDILIKILDRLDAIYYELKDMKMKHG